MRVTTIKSTIRVRRGDYQFEEFFAEGVLEDTECQDTAAKELIGYVRNHLGIDKRVGEAKNEKAEAPSEDNSKVEAEEAKKKKAEAAKKKKAEEAKKKKAEAAKKKKAEEAKKKKAEEEEDFSDFEEEEAEEKVELTHDIVKEELVKFAKKKGKTKALEMLKEQGVSKVADLDEDVLEEFYNKVQKALK